MECFKIENLNFGYPTRTKLALYEINLTVNKGEFITICGKSGCGKTTLLRLLKPALSPFGKMTGNICFNGKSLDKYSPKEQASQIGFVLQNPDNGIVTDKVWHELAFGLESLGLSNSDIRTKVAETASFFGIQTWFDKSVDELSGGQKQILNLASVIVMQPSVLILDEPTSRLDPVSSQDFLNALERINRELGITVIISEHNLEEVIPISDRVIFMDEGRIVVDSSPKNLVDTVMSFHDDFKHSLPVPMRVYYEVENTLDCPVNVREGRKWLEEYSQNHTLKNKEQNNSFEDIKENEVVVDVNDVWFKYDKNLPDIVKGLNFKVKKSELYAIVGGNGAGKSTAMSLITGINKPYRGEVRINGKIVSEITKQNGRIISALPQNPQSLFVRKTVRSDLEQVLTYQKLSKDEINKRINNISSVCKIESLLDYHPYDLSGGEQQRAALAKVLLGFPEILILDEPTKGLDTYFKQEFAEILKELKKSGVTIIMVSHDIEFCAAYADRCAMFFDGCITAENNSRNFFCGNSFYTTSANRMSRGIISDAILAEDIVYACTGKEIIGNDKCNKRIDFVGYSGGSSVSDNSDAYEAFSRKAEFINNTEISKPGVKLPKRTIIGAIMILLAIPLTIFLGVKFLDDRKYYFISLMIIFETILPFVMVFEGRKPKARELVIISTLCGIAVAGRAAFFMIPQFKPVVAIVIISGVCFGAESGFLVGALSAFVSNLFFGQGPWTPWQMFAFGIIGFVSGILYNKKILGKSKISMSIFGFLATLVFYGGIMNTSYVFQAQGQPGLAMFATVAISGLPFDLIHSVSTAVFLLFISDVMIDKLERIKIKYGIIDK